jgi:hypothetical protein
MVGKSKNYNQRRLRRRRLRRRRRHHRNETKIVTKTEPL